MGKILKWYINAPHRRQPCLRIHNVSAKHANLYFSTSRNQNFSIYYTLYIYLLSYKIYFVRIVCRVSLRWYTRRIWILVAIFMLNIRRRWRLRVLYQGTIPGANAGKNFEGGFKIDILSSLIILTKFFLTHFYYNTEFWVVFANNSTNVTSFISNIIYKWE